ncbi:ComEC/Rec2 family competence protein [Virgibacillus xinjiangensis]|uniref:ComEC/Rec2 family competence protein n=1 Tax=Virgibacillus xinjiangensis TaxID=393090 RepID=A0ABV7CSH1_9BACI
MNKRKKRLPVFIFCLLFLLAPSPIQGERMPEMLVHFIDVGQGDSILIQTPSDKTILIDAGPPDAGEKVTSYLKEQQVSEIDLLVATHPDIDHIGGLPKVINSVKVKKILDSGKLHTTKTYAKYIRTVRKHDIPVTIAKQGDEVQLDSKLDIRVLNSHSGFKSNNQSSIVLKITYGKIDFLLTSDVEKSQEKSLLKENVEAEIMKVAHHGSKTSSSLAFLKKVNPQAAILTYHVENDFGHPVDRVISNLHKVDADIYSTAMFGDVVITTNGEDYFLLPERNPFYNLDREAG